MGTSAANAFACGGRTFQSALQTPVRERNRQLWFDPGSHQLKKLQKECNGKDYAYAIIEEIGMMSSDNASYCVARLT